MKYESINTKKNMLRHYTSLLSSMLQENCQVLKCITKISTTG